MKLYLQNTLHGLVPLYPSDFLEKRKLKLGSIYECEVKNPRNYKFLKKFMALINIGVENTSIDIPFDAYRRYITIKAGYYNAYQTSKGIYYEAMSISFASMKEEKFQEVYSRVLDVIIKDIGATKEDITEQLINFM